MQIDVGLNGPQLRALGAFGPRQTICIPWGRGVGKSYFIRLMAWLQVAQWDGRLRDNALKTMRGIRIVMLSPTFKQWRDVHAALVEQELADEWAFLGAKIDRTTYRIEFPGGSWVQPFPAQAHSSKTARGLRCDAVLLDETDDIDIDAFDSVARPWFSEPWSLKMRLAGGTPRRGRHGLLYTLHKAGLSADPADSRYHTIHATYQDAPETVDAAEVEDARRQMLPAAFAREWLCDFDSAEGLVYPFDESFHVRAPHPGLRFAEEFVGVDHGWNDPGVFLRIGVLGHGNDAIAWVLGEQYEREKPNGWWNDRAREHIAQRRTMFFCDPSRPDRISDLCGLGAHAIGADNDIEAGVARVADMLCIREGEDGKRRARLFIDPSCRNTIHEFVNYRRKRDPKVADGFMEAIEDRNNHCLTAGTQVLTSRGEVPIESVAPGDEVLTRQGWRRVEWSGCTVENAPVWRLETTRGIVEGTADHLVWTKNRGWVPLDATRYGDILAAWESTVERCGRVSTERPSDGTQIPQIQTPRCTSAPADTEARRTDICTERSGRPTTVQSQPGITCTIETATRSTTLSRISSACLVESTSLTMAKSATMRSEPSREHTSKESARSPQHGTRVSKGEHGTLSTQERLSRDDSHCLLSASSAPSRSKRWDDASQIDSAQTLASRGGDGPAASTTRPATVSSAALDSRSTDTREFVLVPARVLASYSAERSAAVYDLTVMGEHEFFANGVLVHNSMDALRYALLMRFGRLQHTKHVAPGR